MVKVLISIADISDSRNVTFRVVDAGSKEAILAEKLNGSFQFIDDLFDLLEALDNKDTYTSNNLPCTIEAIYTIGVIY